MMKAQQKILNRDGIKYFAVFAMLLNHISYIFFDQASLLGIILTDIGYFTGITMIWFVVEGYTFTRSKKRYAQRLLLFALISEVPYCLAFTRGQVISFYGINMIFTLFVCFLIVHIMKVWQDGAKKSLAVVLLVFSTFLCDWGIAGPLFAVFFVQAGSGPEKQKTAWKKAVLLFGILNLFSVPEQYRGVTALLYAAGTMAAPALAGVCILHFYNGRKMTKGHGFSKWFFYIFYPAHLLLLGVLRIAAGM